MKTEIHFEGMKFQKLLDGEKNAIQYNENNKDSQTEQVEKEIIRHLAELTVWRLNNEK